ncbi:MAG: histidine kinase [Nocardioidaceae bacterium]|nr:histidine kinase [Nocardioidaceae bacterium]MCL2612537.1 histidine kinase [Nocardioidaceae bacterium]
MFGRRGQFGSQADRTTFRTLHTASLMTATLRDGLSRTTAEQSVRHMRTLVSAPAVAVTDTERLLAWDGVRSAHGRHAADLAHEVSTYGAATVVPHNRFDCGDAQCALRQAIVAPLSVGERVVGTLQVFTQQASAGRVRAATEVARWVSAQLELGELDSSRQRLMAAEVKALRAQISPHFVYNSLTAIASFVRTDPDRARDLLIDFADFTRYSFRKLGDYTTLEEELSSIQRYLVLEQARFGSRLGVTLQIAPEVLPVTIPVLSLQPLVENAVRHGLAPKPEGGSVTISARDLDREAVITIDDDGVGEDPERIRRVLSGDATLDSVGLANVDERLRSSFGDDYGLVVETAPGAGTRVTVRVPKYAAGVRP